MTCVRSLRCIDCGSEYAAEDLISTCTKCARQGLRFGLLARTYDYPRIGEKLNKIVPKKKAICLEIKRAATDINLL